MYTEFIPTPLTSKQVLISVIHHFIIKLSPIGVHSLTSFSFAKDVNQHASVTGYAVAKFQKREEVFFNAIYITYSLIVVCIPKLSVASQRYLPTFLKGKLVHSH